MIANDSWKDLTAVFRNVFAREDMILSPELTANEVPGWDSLTHLRLIMTVEQAFRVRFSAAEIGGVENVGDLMSLLQRKGTATRY
jgi:acyl carrier protein